MSQPSQQSSQLYFEDVFDKIEQILANRVELSNKDIQELTQLIKGLKDEYGDSTIPTSILTANNPQSINQYIRSQMDKLSTRYKRNKCKMSLFRLAHQVLHDSYLTKAIKQQRGARDFFSNSPSSSI